MQRKLIGLTSLAFIAMSAQAATQQEFSDWDSNGNQKISQKEWKNNCKDSTIFQAWDVDNNSYVDSDEISYGLFRHWDENDDGVLEESEWSKANDKWLSDYNTEFSAWDSDGDSLIEYREYEPMFLSTGFYSDWDTNSSLYLEKPELCSALFQRADTDQNGSINVGEYDNEVVYWYVY